MGIYQALKYEYARRKRARVFHRGVRETDSIGRSEKESLLVSFERRLELI